MQLNPRPYLIILVTVILLFTVFVLLRNTGFGRQIQHWGATHQAAMKLIVMIAFFLVAAAAVPVVLYNFLKLQSRIGNDVQPLVKLIQQHPMKLIWLVWIIFGLGIAIALPVMIKDGFLSNTIK